MRVVLAVAVFLSFAALPVHGADGVPKSFESNKCVRCHSVKKLGLGVSGKPKKGPDLAEAAAGGLDADFLGEFLRKKVKQNGKKHPKKFKGSDAELNELVSWIVGLAK